MTTNCFELDPGTLHFAATFLTSQCTAVLEWVGDSPRRNRIILGNSYLRRHTEAD